jgi:hemerythrin superfamily protein
MDLWTFIANDHTEIVALFDELESTGDRGTAERTKQCQKPRLRLLAHAEMETKVFYPALTGHQGAGRLLAEAIEDHEEVERLLDEIVDERTTGRRWEITLFALRALVRQHFAEEEGEIVPFAQRVVGDADAQRRLLDRMAAERNGFIEAAGAAAAGPVSPWR